MTDVYTADPFRNEGSVTTHDPFTLPGGAGELYEINFDVGVGLAPALVNTSSYERNQDVAFTISPQMEKESFRLQPMVSSLLFSAGIVKQVPKTLAASLTLTPQQGLQNFYEIALPGSVAFESALIQAMKYHVALDSGLSLDPAISPTSQYFRNFAKVFNLSVNLDKIPGYQFATEVHLSANITRAALYYLALANEFNFSADLDLVGAINLSTEISLSADISETISYFRTLGGALSLSADLGKIAEYNLAAGVHFSNSLQRTISMTIPLELLTDTEVTISKFNQVYLESVVIFDAVLDKVQTMKFFIALEGLIEFIGDLVTEFIAGPVEEAPGGGGPGGRVQRRKPTRRRRGAEKKPLEAQAERILTSSNLPNYYPLGAKKAYNNMQEFYGSLDGRRIFIKKALEQGRGQTLREKIADVYATGTTVDQRKKMKTQVTMRGNSGPTVKILSSRGVKKG